MQVSVDRSQVLTLNDDLKEENFFSVFDEIPDAQAVERIIICKLMFDQQFLVI